MRQVSESRMGLRQLLSLQPPDRNGPQTEERGRDTVRLKEARPGQQGEEEEAESGGETTKRERQNKEQHTSPLAS